MDTGRPKVGPAARFMDAMLRQIQLEAGIPSMPGEDRGVSVMVFTLPARIYLRVNCLIWNVWTGIAGAPIGHQHRQILHRSIEREMEGKYGHVPDPHPKYKCFYLLKLVSGMVEPLRQSPGPHHCHQADGNLFPLWKELSSRLENTINIVYLHEVHSPFRKMLILKQTPHQTICQHYERVTFSMEIQIVGKDSLGLTRKLDIIFDVVKIGWYEVYQETEIETLYREFVEKVGPEVAHSSDEWACLECGLPATDIAWMSLYTVLEDLFKRCIILISAGCKKCARKMQRATPKLAEIYNQSCADDDQSSSAAVNTMARPNALSGGLSSACLACHNEPALSGMLRCGKCKLASAGCQKEDWARHKKICGTIQSVSMTFFEAKEEGRSNA
ncbi:hypothetical protein C8R45DRAFT_1175662 [Mycena sanguinolenta]|nr:hypothetical protein C8R45DRAFT_1175662 [Mycena sanguinolenta]